ncbi:MAG: SCO family protein [Opitutae bacterium]|nr:SCO family protein [Opitutae bacterium]MDG1301683.1 SCO family protein [Opitutae bacterium]
MRCILYSIFLQLLALSPLVAESLFVTGRVLEVLPETRSMRLALTASVDAEIPAGQTIEFRVGASDIEIGYLGRVIRAEAVKYSQAWHLERIFPVDGTGAKAMIDINKQLHTATATMSRRKSVREGDYIPNFAMIDQHGDFLQIVAMRGKAFVLNFIFTRCQVATMCPASTIRMSELQELSREMTMEDLHFVSITFDPEFDSPGILRQYAKGYGLENDNFHLLTGTQEVVDDLLRQFGIVSMEEDGTINHTMATLLVDANGRVAFRKEGSKWTTKEFLQEARAL